MSTQAAETPAVEIANVTKDFPLGLRGMKLRAVDHLALTVAEKQVFGLLGPNGSGKSTTIKMILGLLEPSSGSCKVFGVPCNRTESRLDVGYLPESPYFYRFLSGFELVAFCARLCSMPGKGLRERVEEVIEWVGLKDAAHRSVGTYSKGMLQRIGLAQALVHDPRLLVLDEPTAGVDPVGSAEIGALISDLRRRGKTIILCSHLLAQVEGLCDRIAILDRGRLVLEGQVSDLLGEKGRESLVVEGFAPERETELRTWLEERGARLLSVSQPRRTLDQLFLEHVGNSRTSPAPHQSADPTAAQRSGS
jgi:ABC-2 type transport system ATP-binding protein